MIILDVIGILTFIPGLFTDSWGYALAGMIWAANCLLKDLTR